MILQHKIHAHSFSTLQIKSINVDCTSTIFNKNCKTCQDGANRTKSSAYAKTRNSPGDDSERELHLRHRTRTTIDSCIKSATDRRGYVLESMFIKFSEITQCNGHYAVQGHSSLPILVPIESSYTTSY